jgi:hypothetical protein
MIFAIWALQCAKLVRNEVCIDSSGILDGSWYRGVLQEPIFDSMYFLEEIVFHESAGNPRGTRLLVGGHMTISAPMKVETDHVRGRIGRISLKIQLLGCIRVKCFLVYVYLG